MTPFLPTLPGNFVYSICGIKPKQEDAGKLSLSLGAPQPWGFDYRVPAGFKPFDKVATEVKYLGSVSPVFDRVHHSVIVLQCRGLFSCCCHCCW
jgi:hypothetical protein